MPKGIREPLAVRFERFLVRGEPDECWPWLGHKNSAGFVRWSGFSMYAVAKEYGISEATISQIIKGKTWSHVQCPF
jgi:hypothetical protein